MNLSAYLEFDPKNPCVITDINLLRLKVKDDYRVQVLKNPNPFPCDDVPLYVTRPIKSHVPIFDMFDDSKNTTVIKLWFVFEYENNGEKQPLKCTVYRRARWTKNLNELQL